jgi:hypothetical protein
VLLQGAQRTILPSGLILCSWVASNMTRHRTDPHSYFFEQRILIDVLPPFS